MLTLDLRLYFCVNILSLKAVSGRNSLIVIRGFQMHQLIIRPGCPVCGQVAVKTLCSLPFDIGVIREYIDSHYKGRAELDRLGDAKYELSPAAECVDRVVRSA
jgi:hypothetical protein